MSSRGHKRPPSLMLDTLDVHVVTLISILFPLKFIIHVWSQYALGSCKIF